MHQKAPVPKRTLGQKTEDRLMKFILDEPIQVGEKIPNEYELTERFQVGRSTVREAVKGLVSRGVLEVRRGDGTYVISTSYMENDVLGFGSVQDKYQLAMDLFEVRLMFEPEIVMLACKNATEEQIKEAERLCKEVEDKLENRIKSPPKRIQVKLIVDQLLEAVKKELLLYCHDSNNSSYSFFFIFFHINNICTCVMRICVKP